MFANVNKRIGNTPMPTSGQFPWPPCEEHPVSAVHFGLTARSGGLAYCQICGQYFHPNPEDIPPPPPTRIPPPET